MNLIREIFLTICNMSFTAGIVILLVLLARQLLRKSPKIFSYMLWGIVAFRLICPFSFSSRYSLFSLDPVKQACLLRESDDLEHHKRSAISQD